jgi:hypothetical protein
LLQRTFRDLFLSDRLEIQTRVPGVVGNDEGLTWVNWEPVENFLESGPDHRHYVVDSQTGIIRFGNGLNGRVPIQSELIRARFYRYSQMESGNVPPRRQWSIGFPLPTGTSISRSENMTAATGGRKKETVDETRSRAREVFRKETAILTAKDYERLVSSTPGLRVAQVKVIPNFNPKLSCLRLPGEVTIIVLPQPAPKKAFPDAPPPEPSDGFLATIQNHLESRRLVTTNIHVVGPQYFPVKVACKVFLKKRASVTEAHKNIREALADFFNPVFGGPEKGEGWPFGRSVFPSEISQQLTKLAAVDYVTSVKLNDLNPGEPLKLPYNGLPTSGAHAITTVPFEDRARVADVGKEGVKAAGVQYVAVRVSCKVVLKKRVSPREARKSINEALADFLDPVFGGPQQGLGWSCGCLVLPSEVSQQLARLPNVENVTNVRLNDLKAGEPVELPYNGLPISGVHNITILPSDDCGPVEVDEGCSCD